MQNENEEIKNGESAQNERASSNILDTLNTLVLLAMG